MSARLYVAAQHDEGFRQAERFLDRLATGPCGADDLAQELSIARFGSLERQRAFCARLQQALLEGVRDA
ncbi:MAG: hypothetical protein ROZ64_16585 [Burkholderiaceae bacterium]|jgi:hypothetical protein|nr:hypothetical protein [Burkholderiaceae bacterium]